ncbi:MAG: imidazole glycerol phosphate synthase subunit HisH [Candidatus Thorarchaeota archaeon]
MSFNIAIIDYEMGNLKSISKCLKYLNVNSFITDNPNLIKDSNGIILPGVGAFKNAMRNLKEKDLVNLIEDVVKEGKPILGICLGLQLLCSKSFEMGETKGLDLIKGKVVAFEKTKVEKIPHIGWNNVKFQDMNHFLVEGIPDNSFFYFVHSFYAVPKKSEYSIGLTDYGKMQFSSIVGKNHIIATQFHPEKSSKNGIKLYQNFINFCKK